MGFPPRRAQLVELAICMSVLVGDDIPSPQAVWKDIMHIVPRSEKALQALLMVCRHMTDAIHWGMKATLHGIEAYCVCDNVRDGVVELVQQYLHYADSNVRNMAPRLLRKSNMARRWDICFTLIIQACAKVTRWR